MTSVSLKVARLKRKRDGSIACNLSSKRKQRRSQDCSWSRSGRPMGQLPTLHFQRRTRTLFSPYTSHWIQPEAGGGLIWRNGNPSPSPPKTTLRNKSALTSSLGQGDAPKGILSKTRCKQNKTRYKNWGKLEKLHMCSTCPLATTLLPFSAWPCDLSGFFFVIYS